MKHYEITQNEPVEPIPSLLEESGQVDCAARTVGGYRYLRLSVWRSGRRHVQYMMEDRTP